MRRPTKEESAPSIVPLNPLGTFDATELHTHGFPEVKLLPEQCLNVAHQLNKILAASKDPKLSEWKEKAAALLPNAYFAANCDRIRIHLNDVGDGLFSLFFPDF